MSALDFLVAFGAVCFWTCVAGCIAWAAAVAYRKLVDRLFGPAEPHPGHLPRETFENFCEPYDQHAVPESGLTAHELEVWPVEEPQR